MNPSEARDVQIERPTLLAQSGEIQIELVVEQSEHAAEHEPVEAVEQPQFETLSDRQVPDTALPEHMAGIDLDHIQQVALQLISSQSAASSLPPAQPRQDDPRGSDRAAAHYWETQAA